MIFSDLRELKKVLDLDPADSSQDYKLLIYAEWATSIINDFLGKSVDYKSRTQYYSGTGTNALLLKNRPVYAAPSGNFSALTVIEDDNGLWGTASGSFAGTNANTLTYGQDYTMVIDQDDGGSRQAILVRVNDCWHRPYVRYNNLLSPYVGQALGNYQVVYTAGFTVDTLPGAFRAAADMLVARLSYIFPLGMELSSESYEERSISLITPQKDYLLALIKPLIFQFKNWRW